MSALRQIKDAYAVWLDAVAGTVAGFVDRFAQPRSVRIVQRGSDQFELAYVGESRPPVMGNFQLGTGRPPAAIADAISGARVELLLQPELFLFRSIELPSRAADFLPGIIRAQIDRLTPWSAAAAVFGWSRPLATNGDQMTVAIAATARSLLEQYTQALTKLGAHSVSVLTQSSVEASGPIEVLNERARGALEIGRIRKALATVLAASLIVAGTFVGGAMLVDMSLAMREADVAQQLAKLRASASSVQQMAQRRKLQSPATIVVLDALSEILPDHTYVTEFRVEENKVRLTGISRDATSLIGLIERSGRFARANFFAPTTRSSSDGTERFHIEAIIQTKTASQS